MGKQSFLDDLASLDPELYNGLIFLKNYTGNPEDLSLNFAVATEGPLDLRRAPAGDFLSCIRMAFGWWALHVKIIVGLLPHHITVFTICI